MCSFSPSKPPGRYGEKRIPFTGSCRQHTATYVEMAGRAGSLFRIRSSWRRRIGAPLLIPGALSKPLIPRHCNGPRSVPTHWHRRLLRGPGPRSPLPSPSFSVASVRQRDPDKNRTLFLPSVMKVLQRQQMESSPRTALVSLRREGPPRRPGHGRGCAGPGSGRRGPSPRSRGLACPRCGRDGRQSGSTCRRRARRRRGNT